MYLATSMCPGEHLLLNCNMMLVMVARSGLVWQLSQLRWPTYSCWMFIEDMVFVDGHIDVRKLVRSSHYWSSHECRGYQGLRCNILRGLGCRFCLF